MQVGRKRRGSTLLYVTLSLAVLFALVSLAIDLGRARLVKTELQRVADAAARAGAAGLATSTTQARTNALDIASKNTVDGSYFTSMSNSDVEVGYWNGSAFAANGAPTNAVRVTARRTAATGNAVSTMFARVVGMNSVDVIARSVAKYQSGTVSGFIGYDGITFKNNGEVRSYSSSTNLNPTSGSASNNSGLASNGEIKGKHAQTNTLYGHATLGPSGSANDITITGGTTALTTSLAAPTLPTWSAGANPGGVSQNYTVSSDTTLAGGSYWFTSLTINGGKTLSFSGSTTLYINGDVDINGNLRPTSLVPSDLTIYQYGSNDFGDSKNNNVDVVGILIAPQVTLTFKNNFKLRGSIKVKTMEFKNNADLYYDEALGDARGGTRISLTD